MNKSTVVFPQAPVFVAERVIDDRYTRFGKKVVERDFRMPDGKVLAMICVLSPNMEPFIVFPITEHGTVLLVNQFRFATNEWTLELPGGCPKLGQSWEEVARGELLEETGAEAATMEIIGKPMLFNPALQDARFTAVLATGCKVVRYQNLDEGEQMTVMEFRIEEFRRMLRGGVIIDAKTIAVGYLTLDHLGLL